MKSSCIAAFLLFTSSAFLPAGDKSKSAQVTVLEMAVHRGEGIIEVNARVKNSSARNIGELTVIFRFLAVDKSTVTTQRYVVDEPTLAPENESEIHAQLKDAGRATDVLILALDGDGRELKVGNAGPFVIE